MSAEENKGRLISSWKEIAEYLQCDVRTCLRWERTRGLPIHRLDGTGRSRVFAYQDQLDRWVKGRNGSGEGLSEASFPTSVVSFRIRYLFFAIPVVAAITLIYVFFLRPGPHHSDPVDFRIDGSELTILAKDGKELWKINTHIENLCSDKDYHNHFQIKRPGGNLGTPFLPWIMFKDLNNDQKLEVLFSTRASDDRRGASLLCFDSRGNEIWRFKPGREMWCGERPFSSDYSIFGFETADNDNDGQLEVIVIGLQNPNWLTQIASLSSNGKVIGEFWNSGQINDLIIEDLNGDGKKELVVVGLNNEYKKGCLIVLDPRQITGASPQADPEYICRGLKPGLEKYYVLFPRTDVDTDLYPVEAIANLYAQPPNILSMEAAVSGIIFVLNYDLVVADVTLSHGFSQKHKEALEAGKIKSNLSDSRYKEGLMKGVLYYDGKGWTTRPTPVNHRAG